jgi:hypothetical protein
MNLTSISAYRNDDGSTDVHFQVSVPRGARLDLGVINRAIALLDSGGDVPDAPANLTTGADTGSAAPAATSRRGRRAKAQDETTADATSHTEAEASPTTGRRGRRSGATPAADAGASPAATASTAETKSPSEPEPAKEPVRRRRAQPEEPAGISDADVAKAASEAARVLGNPEEVMSILGEFGVTETSALPQNVRQEFLDICNVEIEKQG